MRTLSPEQLAMAAGHFRAAIPGVCGDCLPLRQLVQAAGDAALSFPAQALLDRLSRSGGFRISRYESGCLIEAASENDLDDARSLLTRTYGPLLAFGTVHRSAVICSHVARAGCVLTTSDHGRLKAFSRHSPELAQLLDAATLVPPRAVSPDVITMYSLVRLEVKGDPERQTRVVCYPEDEDAAGGFVSILFRPGVDLLGLRVGSILPWVMPEGGHTTAEVSAILFQPEAAGDFDL